MIDDLKTLWNVDIKTYDAYRKEIFNLQAVLFWTISDFPAYGNLSACSIKGHYACLVFSPNKCSIWLTHSRKCVYLGHCQFLPNNHSFRSLKKVFNNEIEKEEPPKYLTNEDILKLVDDIDYKSGKHKGSKRKSDDCDDDSNKLFKRKSIFFI